MKSFLINTCLGEKVGSKPQARAKRSILELYDSSEDELNQEPPKKKHLPVVIQNPNDTIPSLLMLTGSLHALIFMCRLLYVRAFFKNSSVGGPSTKRDHTIPSVEK